MSLWKTFVAVLITATPATHGKTAVFFPPPISSYFVYHTNVAGELARLGHDVWLCVPHSMVAKNLVKDKDVKVIEYAEHLGDLEKRVYEKTNIVERFWSGKSSERIQDVINMGEVVAEITRDVLSDASFTDRIRNLKPDLFVLESVPFSMNMIVLPYMLDIPYALIGTFHDVILSKVPFSPGTSPFSVGTVSDNMSFFQRVTSTLLYLVRINFDLFYDSSIVSEFAPHKPYKSINELAANAEIFIAEVDHILDYPRPTLPNTKLVGGSSASPAKPLVGEFQKFVEDSKNGIIVVSFGGSVVNIPLYITSKMISAFKELDLRVIWRVNMTSPEPNQIMTSIWIPQNDLLGHEKTKLFVSHCGKNGQYEALYHAVPILCLPIFGDQGYNAERVRVKQLGLLADMREASAEELAGLMKEIIYDKKYSENMKKASRLYRELYKVPKKEAAFWLDHVVEFGGDYMRSSAQLMPWHQLFALDILAFLTCIMFVIILLVYLLTRQCYVCCKDRRNSVKSKTE